MKAPLWGIRIRNQQDVSDWSWAHVQKGHVELGQGEPFGDLSLLNVRATETQRQQAGVGGGGGPEKSGEIIVNKDNERANPCLLEVPFAVSRFPLGPLCILAIIHFI